MSKKIDVVGSRSTVNSVLGKKFMSTMSKIQDLYLKDKDVLLTPSEAAAINYGVTSLLTIVEENTTLFNYLEQQGLLNFTEHTPETLQ